MCQNKQQMKKEILANGFVLIGIIAYNFLFWGETLGLNILIFSTFIVGSLFTLYPESRKSKMAIITAIGTLFSAAMIVYNNSMFSKVIHFVSLIATVGFVQQHVLRFFWFGFLVLFLNIIELPTRWLKELRGLTRHIKGIYKIKRFVKLAILPSFVLLAFYGIYAFANPAFAKISSTFLLNVNNFLFGWFEAVSLTRVLFNFIGFFFISLVIYRNGFSWLQELERRKQFRLTRTLAPARRILHWMKIELQNESSTNITPSKSKFSTIGLKNEYRMASMLLWSLNGLLLVVNFTDIQYVWSDFSEKSATELRQFVHEGTYLLIFAIILAMGVILFYFRKNLNFYPKNTILKTAAYVWIFQNVLLAFSVGVRNYHYISHFGLAYKRIGVFIFLFFTAIGLVTMFLKVRDKRTSYFLFFNNSWAIYLVLMSLTCLNWDVMITRYNLANADKTELDMRFLLSEVSDKNLWLLEEVDFDKLTDKSIMIYDHNNNKYAYTTLRDYFLGKKQQFLNRPKRYSWASWNYADYVNEKRLK
jgi:hypothetical protein